MYLYLFVLYFFLGFISVFSDSGCTRPEDIKEKESYCWKKEVEIVDRIQQTSKSVLDFAKKKLGIKANEQPKEPQKCEYYQCIFQQLQLFNTNGVPVYDNVMNWIEDHVTYHQAKDLLEQFNKCNDALISSKDNKVPFVADEVVAEHNEKANGSSSESHSTQDEPQSKCHVAAEFMKCLSNQKGCPVFQYP